MQVTFKSCLSDETEVTVTADCSPGTPDVWYLPNGDPGYPGDPPECNLQSVLNGDGKDLLTRLTDEEVGRLETEAWDEFGKPAPRREWGPEFL